MSPATRPSVARASPGLARQRCRVDSRGPLHDLAPTCPSTDRRQRTWRENRASHGLPGLRHARCRAVRRPHAGRRCPPRRRLAPSRPPEGPDRHAGDRRRGPGLHRRGRASGSDPQAQTRRNHSPGRDQPGRRAHVRRTVRSHGSARREAAGPRPVRRERPTRRRVRRRLALDAAGSGRLRRRQHRGGRGARRQPEGREAHHRHPQAGHRSVRGAEEAGPVVLAGPHHRQGRRRSPDRPDGWRNPGRPRRSSQGVSGGLGPADPRPASLGGGLHRCRRHRRRAGHRLRPHPRRPEGSGREVRELHHGRHCHRRQRPRHPRGVDGRRQRRRVRRQAQGGRSRRRADDRQGARRRWLRRGLLGPGRHGLGRGPGGRRRQHEPGR